MGAAALACAAPARAQTGGLKLTLGTNAGDDVTPLLWARASGMFSRAGLDVDIQKFTSGSVVTSAVIGGSLDMGRASMLPLISARSRGIPLSLVAPGELALADDPTEAIVVLSASPAAGGKDLNGATMPVPALHDFFHISTRTWIDASGGDSSTVRFVELPESAVVPALLDGRVAAAMLTGPFLSSALASGKVRIIGRPDAAIGKRLLVTAYFSTDAFAAANRDALTKFAATMQQAAAYTNTHHAETVAVVAPFWGIDPAKLSEMKRTIQAPALDPKDIQPLIDAAVRYGVIPKPLAADSMIAPGLIAK